MKENFRAFPAYSFRGAHGDTSAAVDTFVVAHVFYIHLTCLYAQSAVHAFLLIELDAYKRYSVKKAVNRAQRTEEAAEEAVNEYTADNKYNEKYKLPAEQIAQHIEEVRVGGVG